MYIGHDVVGGSERATVVRSARDDARAAKKCLLLPSMVGSPYRGGWPCYLTVIGDSLCWQMQSDYQLSARGDFKRIMTPIFTGTIISNLMFMGVSFVEYTIYTPIT
jgi:hypothetical protein